MFQKPSQTLLLAFLISTVLSGTFAHADANKVEPKVEETKSEDSKVAEKPSDCCITYTKDELDAAWDKRHDLHLKLVETFSNGIPVPEDYEVAWRVSRLAFFTGMYALPAGSPNEKKMKIYEYGMDAANRARRINKGRVEGHYFFAINQGVHGLAKGVLASLKAAGAMREALDEAVRIDPNFDFGGPLRVRGRLFFQLPGGFLSFGDNKLAHEDLKKAVAAFPNHKLNLVYFADTQIKIEKKEAATKTVEAAKVAPDVAGVDEEKGYRRDVAKIEKKLK